MKNKDNNESGTEGLWDRQYFLFLGYQNGFTILISEANANIFIPLMSDINTWIIFLMTNMFALTVSTPYNPSKFSYGQTQNFPPL